MVAPGRIAVIDIGANSLRLVVYSGAVRAPIALFNEKALCGLGRGLGKSGRLNPEAVGPALDNVRRFVALARAVDVVRLDIIATAAVRDASDGREFVNAVKAECGVSVRTLDGAGEGRLSALGVIAGVPTADGVVGDLGGGSVELVRVDLGQLGAGETLPLGPLRLAEFIDDERRLRDVVDKHIASVDWLRRYRGRGLYLVGGAWRALARIHMEQANYPLHIIQNYEISRGEAQQVFPVLGRQSRKSLEKLAVVSKRRIEAVPLAALVLSRLVNVIEPDRLVFSAFGLREGHVYDLLSEAEQRQDPLLSACREIAARSPRFGIAGDEIFEWSAPLFSGEEPRRRRLRLAACLLGDTAWTEHPDYRADEAFQRRLRMPVAGIDHAERVFVANVLHARYGGAADAEVKETTRRLIAEEDHMAARAIGLALRLGYTLSGGAPAVLAHTRLALRDDAVVLTVPEGEPLSAGETVQRRLDALGRAFDRRGVIRHADRKLAAS